MAHLPVFVIDLKDGLLSEHTDDRFTTRLVGFTPGCALQLPEGYTYLGVILEGTVVLSYSLRKRSLFAADYFSVIGPARISGDGTGIAAAAFGYVGMNVFGGPIEATGRLRYIDGCSDSLLIPPVRKGDPCLNHLHFPAGTHQTPHTHPSIRIGVVLAGRGDCLVPERDPIPLHPGSAFIIPTNAVHSFATGSGTMDVVAFHPDSDVGVTDDDHPMVNRTIVNGVSARHIASIRSAADVIEQ